MGESCRAIRSRPMHHGVGAKSKTIRPHRRRSYLRGWIAPSDVGHVLFSEAARPNVVSSSFLSNTGHLFLISSREIAMTPRLSAAQACVETLCGVKLKINSFTDVPEGSKMG